MKGEKKKKERKQRKTERVKGKIRYINKNDKIDGADRFLIHGQIERKTEEVIKTDTLTNNS